MAYLVDASVAVKWLVTEEDSERAHALLDSDADLLAPQFVFDEVANVLWKKCRLGLLQPDDAISRMHQLPGFFDQIVADADVGKVLALTIKLDHPVYDCIYLQAALGSGLPAGHGRHPIDQDGSTDSDADHS
ncbi:type II toxin-antitoxin system VapC family toxin [Rhodopseudomonas palustris]|uniref:type II toxin-antitoxin system VapC family toxin n=1 Tax=Rhodopseudomonas palustris TaxID=1076 RepID=UPI000CEBB150|nr:type II toxin-antitoxin system VapC family toxin [Rhodopseudomonas palustris]PPQ44049.1 VapC toxin family PIN domain ribonuclease [Rhodopseudomonas palustris]